MGKILSYSQLTTPASGDVLFIGDVSVSAVNPEIKYITHSDLFKSSTLKALDANGISIYDASSNLGVFIKDGGNVGVNQSNPSYNLDVSGSFRATSIVDESGSSGPTNYIITKTATGFQWAANTAGDGKTDGSGTAGKVAKWSGSTTLTDSVISEVSGDIGISEGTPGAKLHITGTGADLLHLESSDDQPQLVLIGNTTTYYISTSSTILSLGGSGTAGSSTFNISNTGNVHVGGTDLTYRLQVTSSSYETSRINGTNGAGACVSLVSNQTNPVDEVFTFSRTVSSTANVNWLIGNLYRSSASYFGIHWRNATLNATNAKFDSTLANNLFYVDTSGNTNIAGAITTHQVVSTGHNKGRFVQIFSIPVTIAPQIEGYYPAFNGRPLHSASTDLPMTSNNTWDESIVARAPYDGKLIKIEVAGEIVGTASLTHNLTYDFWNLGTASPFPVSEPASAAATIGSFSTDGLVSTEKLDSNFTGTTSNLTFSKGDLLAFKVSNDGESGSFNLSLTHVFEFLID